MVDLQTASQQVSQARQQLELKKQEVSQAKSQIEEAKSKLPNINSQMNLRKLSRVQRQQIKGTGKQLQSKIGEVESYEEQVIKPYEEQVSQAEQSIQSAQAEQQAQQNVMTAYNKGMLWAVAGYGEGREREIAQQLIKSGASPSLGGELSTQEYNQGVELNKSIASYDSGVPLDQAFSEKQISFLKSKKLLPDDYTPEQKTTANNIFNNQVSTNNVVSNILNSTPTMDRSVSTQVKSSYWDMINRPVIPVVSASSLSSNKDLSSSQAIGSNGNTNVPTRISNGFIGGLWSRVTNLVGDSSDLEKGRQAEKTFTLGNQTFTRVTASPMKETISYVNGQPTPRTSIVETTNWKQPSFTRDVIAPPTRYLAERTPLIKDILISKQSIDIQAKQLGDITSGFDKLSNEEQTKRIQQYQSQGGRVEETNGKLRFIEPTRRIGFGRAVSNVPVSELANKGLVEYGGIVLGKVVGKSVEVTSNDLGITGFSVKTPEKKLDISLPYQTRGTSYSNKEGYFAPTTNIVIPEKTSWYFTPEQIGKVGEFSSRALTFTPEYVGGLGEATLLNGEFGGEKGAVAFVKAKPFETVAIASFGLLKAGKYVGDELGLTKFGKYIKNPETKVTSSVTRDIENVYAPETRKVPRVELNVQEGQINLNVKPKPKGVTKVTETYPSNTMTAKVVETRRVPFTKKLKQYFGEAKIETNTFEEVVDFGKYKRVTKLKDGKGTIELINPEGQVKFSQKVTSDAEGLLKKTKSKIVDVKVDVSTSNPLQVTTINGRKVVRDLQGNRVIDLSGKEPNLASERVTGRFTSDVTQSQNLEKGLFNIQSESYGYSDIIKSGERKSKVQLVNRDKRLNIQQRQGQVIQFGEDLEKDVSKTVSNGVRRVSTRKISPTVEREISEASGTNIIQIYVNPESKILNPLKEAERLKQAKLKELKDVIKQDALEQSNLLKSKVKPSESKNIVRVSQQQATKPIPSYIGGKGGSASESMYGFDSKSMFQEMKSLVNVPESGKLLKGFKGSSKTIPTINEIPKIKSSLELLPRATAMETQTPQIKIENIQKNVQVGVMEQAKVKDVVSVKNIQLPRQEVRNVLKENIKLNQQPVLKEKLISLNVQDTKLNQRQETKQRVKQEPRKTNKPKEPIIKIPIKTSLPQRLAKKITSEPDMFEVFTRKGGQDISIGKTTSKEKAKDILLGKLGMTLRASGFVQTSGGRKLSVGELGNVGINFGRSKKDIFRVIELKNKRLKRGTSEVPEIKAFKKVKGKKSKFGF